MNVFDLLSSTKDDDDADKNAVRTAKLWLKEAGFPQYVQMFNDGDMPISLKSVQEDHTDFDGEALMALFRRIEILNRSIEIKNKKQENVQNFHRVYQQKTRHIQVIEDDEDVKSDSSNHTDPNESIIEGLVNNSSKQNRVCDEDVIKSENSPDNNVDSDENDEDDDKENVLEHIALSSRWCYEPQTRRWSHVEPFQFKDVDQSHQKRKFMSTTVPDNDSVVSNIATVKSEEQTDNNTSNPPASVLRSTSMRLFRAVNRLSQGQFSFRASKKSRNSIESSKSPTSANTSPSVSADDVPCQTAISSSCAAISDPKNYNKERSSSTNNSGTANLSPNLNSRGVTFRNNKSCSDTIENDWVSRRTGSMMYRSERGGHQEYCNSFNSGVELNKDDSLDPVLNLLESDLRSLDAFRAKINSKSSPNIPETATYRPQSCIVRSSHRTHPDILPTVEDSPVLGNKTAIDTKSHAADSSLAKSVTLGPFFPRSASSRWPQNFVEDNFQSKVSTGHLYYYALTNLSVTGINWLKKMALFKSTTILEKHCPSQKNFFSSWKLPRLLTSKERSPLITGIDGMGLKGNNAIGGNANGSNGAGGGTEGTNNASGSSGGVGDGGGGGGGPRNQSLPIFGINIASHQARFGRPLPPVIENIINYLRKKGPTTVGIFRKTGMKARINTLRQMMDNNPKLRIKTFDDYSVYDVADVLKCFFRELPDGIFTNKLSSTLLAIYTYVPESSQLESVQWVLFSLPDENRIILRILLDFLAYLAQFDEVTKMSVKNLSLCFAPSLFSFQNDATSNSTLSPLRNKRSNGSKQKLIGEQNAASLCLTDMILNIKTLFKLDEEMMRKHNLTIKDGEWEPKSVESMREPSVWQMWLGDKISNLCSDTIGVRITSVTGGSNAALGLSSSGNIDGSNKVGGAGTSGSPGGYGNGIGGSTGTSSGAGGGSGSGGGGTISGGSGGGGGGGSSNNNSGRWSDAHKNTVRSALTRYTIDTINDAAEDQHHHSSQDKSNVVNVTAPSWLKLSYRKVGHHSDKVTLRTWRASIDIERKPGYVFTGIRTLRSQWDPFVTECTVVDQVNDYAELIRMDFWNPDGSAQKRRAHLLQSFQLGVGGSGNVIVGESVVFPDVIKDNNYQEDIENNSNSNLCHIIRDDFLIEAVSESLSRVTWLSRVDLYGLHSDWYSSYWGHRMLFGLLTLRKILISNSNKSDSSTSPYIGRYNFESSPETTL